MKSEPTQNKKRWDNVGCSQCGRDFGPGDHGFSHCEDHAAPCSPSDYDAGLLNDFGGGDVGWWQDYLRAEIRRANDYWREIHDRQNVLMVRFYNQGYHAGHEDTVEARFTPIHHADMDTYHADVVAEILQENDQSEPHGPTKKL